MEEVLLKILSALTIVAALVSILGVGFLWVWFASWLIGLGGVGIVAGIVVIAAGLTFLGSFAVNKLDY